MRWRRRSKHGQERRGFKVGNGEKVVGAMGTFYENWKAGKCVGRTYGQIAVLFPVLAYFLFCDGHRFRRVRLWLRLLWRVARAVCLGCDIGGE